MRPDHKTNRPAGRPITLYTMSELHGVEDTLVDVNMQELGACQTESTKKDAYPCDVDIFDLSCILMEENGWNPPNNGYEAASLYINLRQTVHNGLGI